MMGEATDGMMVNSLFGTTAGSGWVNDNQPDNVEKKDDSNVKLLAIVNELMEVPTAPESFDRIVKAALSFFHAERGFFLIRNKEKYIFKSAFDDKGRCLRKENFRILATLIRKTIQSLTTNYLEDKHLNREPSIFNTKTKRISFHYCCPVEHNNELIGVLYLTNPKLLDVNIKILDLFSQFAGKIIHNAWSKEKFRQAEKLRQKKEKDARIAHEMNNAITAAFGNVEIALYYLKSHKNSKEIIKRLSNAGEQLLYMRRFSHALTENNTLIPDKKLLSINEAVSEFVKTIAPIYIRKKAIIETDLRDVPLVKVDIQQIVQVLHNLVKNAIEAKPEGVRIRITTRMSLKTNHVILSVLDDGPGIRRESLNSIFYRTYKASGHGYGLGICREIVENHNGSLTVKSSPGEGANFSIKLPIVQQLQDENEYKPSFEV
ncbi:GAF domain-containing sensor histidine kinase [candidate division KSB1 bacterium]|nr:GAF domain-containing sensor histidine kinase [candidate division KSB1 bacterium]